MKLPDKRSELIRLAVRDAIKISQNPAYKLNMGQWHSTTFWSEEQGEIVKDKRCNVCLAGSVMACTLKARIDKEITPSFFNKDLSSKLNLINNWREGNGDLWNVDYLYDQELTEKQRKAINEAQCIISENYDEELMRADWITYFSAANILEEAGL